MPPSALANSLRNALRPGYAPELGRKALRRLSRRERSGPEARAWAQSVRIDARSVCHAIDAELWDEAVSFRATVRARAEEVSADLGRPAGFGVRADLLYFVTRWRRPAIVVETGVAFGYSSFTILSALERNGGGHLYSSDFPFFREAEPERLVGAMVPAHLRGRWTLYTKGDAQNLPRILQEVDAIDLVHYDSDKSYAGRAHALELIVPRLRVDGVLLMDDIEDNTFFRDRIATGTLCGDDPDYLVIGHGDHFVGTVGLPRPPTRTSG